MKNSWFPILMIIALLGLLVLLATLQYKWLGQISDAEQIRLEERLKDDTKRFAEDFNKEIQEVYYNFQIISEDWDSFSRRYELWQEKVAYKDIIEKIYFIKIDEIYKLSEFNKRSGKFEKANWTDELKNIEKDITIEKDFEKFSNDAFALVVPTYKTNRYIKELTGKQKKIITVNKIDGQVISENIVGSEIKSENAEKLLKQFEAETRVGFLIIKLNKDVVKKEILPTLARKYFSNSEGGSYKISITDQDSNTVFKTHNEISENGDAQTKLFNLNPENLFIFNRKPELSLKNNSAKNKIVYGKSISSTSIHTNTKTNGEGESVEIDIFDTEDKPNVTVNEEKFVTEKEGFWTLKVQHIDGSLEQFIINTRRRNLAISFGILSLLAVSIILIFLSSQRAKSLAQKQMDFVSSVSHEFRTPLAVIYSASENLSDGVIDEREKISSYGNLIKREGKKLSGMVEQILEFAGANSGRRKYDFGIVEIQSIINEAIAECQTSIDENDFVLEKDFATTLPNISADKKALTLAFQNLINNSLKYSNGSRWLKISVQNGKGNLIVSITDRGIGISEKDKKQIFEPFYRATNVVDEQISGNGLGLSLVKQIIDAHGGQIEVKSEVGKGTEFIVHLPLNA